MLFRKEVVYLHHSIISIITKSVYINNLKIRIMESKIIKVGTSLGLIIPGLIAKDFDLKQGTKIEMEVCNGELRIKKKSVRNGWDEAFARYAKEGEDEMIIPDFVDNEAEMLL